MPKNKGHTNFYECCDFTEKVYLTPMYNFVSEHSHILPMYCPWWSNNSNNISLIKSFHELSIIPVRFTSIG